MSWGVSIPQYQEPAEGQEFVNEVEAEKAVGAIDAASLEDAAPGEAKQLDAAKDAAKHLVEHLKGKRAYRINLSGHAAPKEGTGSGNPDSIAVEVVEVP